MIHSMAWVTWLAAAVASVSATRNPLYLIEMLLCLAIVHSLAGGPSATRRAPFSPLRLSIVLVALSTLLNALTSHHGATVIFSLPGSIPLLGGPITLEAMVFGATSGLALAGMFISFAVLNAALPVSALVRLVPRAFHTSAVIVSIAATFVPSAVRQFQEIRDAQAIRGHRMRGFGDWLPLFVPLLVGGLERALQLAETLASRGFAGGTSNDTSGRWRLAFLVGMGSVLAGAVLLLFGSSALTAGLLWAGGGAIAASLWGMGRATPHTVYRAERWTIASTLVVAGALLSTGALLLPLPFLERASLEYYPFPSVALPGFSPWIGVAILGVLGPMLAELLRGESA